MGLVKTRRLAAMQKQQWAKAGMGAPMQKNALRSHPSRPGKSDGRGTKNNVWHLGPCCSDGESSPDSDALWSKSNMSESTNTKRSRRNRRMSESSVTYLFTSLKESLQDFYDHESLLIKYKVSERALTHKLAEHLQKRFKEYNVDCEYNKIGKDPKRVIDLIVQMKLSGKCNAKCNACPNNKCVIFPDIIVHRRGEDDNLLVIEAKTAWSEENQFNDYNKLMALSQSHEFKYKLGVALRFCEGLDSTLKSFQIFSQDKSVRDDLIDVGACAENLVEMPWEPCQ